MDASRLQGGGKGLLLRARVESGGVGGQSAQPRHTLGCAAGKPVCC